MVGTNLQSAPGALDRPNKIGGGYAARAARRAFRARGAAVLGDFPGAAADRRGSSSRPIGAGELAGRIVRNQGVSGSAAAVVAWLASHGPGQAIGFARKPTSRRLMSNLAEGRRQAAPGRLPDHPGSAAEGRPGRPSPPKAKSPARTMVASGGPGVRENRLPASIARRSRPVTACSKQPSSREISIERMGLGVGDAPTRSAGLDRLNGAPSRHNRVGVHGGRPPFGWERIRGSYAGGHGHVNGA